MKCGWKRCGKLFEPNQCSNQHHKPHGEHHKGAVYCSRACQQKAYRWRRSQGVTLAATGVRATVTRQKNNQSYQQVAIAKNDLPWRQIAGPKLTPLQFHCATLTDAVELVECLERS